MKQYKTIVNGATMAGMAIASCDPEGTLIVDRGNQLASDFYASMRTDPMPERAIQGEAARKFRADMKQYPSIVQEGQLAVTEGMPALGRYAESQKLQILFDFLIISRQQDMNHFTLTAICRDEIYHIQAENYVDTTESFAKHAANGMVAESLNLLIRKAGQDPVICPNATIHDFPTGGYYILEMPVDAKLSYPQLRKQALGLFPCTRTDSSDLLLKAADRICVRGKQPSVLSDSNGFILCSCLSEDLLHAMERGEQFWRDCLC
ncbi:hypothetical protein [Lacrimispora sp.]|uniref:hypothetical protein n=1 Tax=Lacrimispora sp. TaxID=2719234 RepID=UPI0028ACB997|nr:hypothetical protein [Lacrimispora sp.]